MDTNLLNILIIFCYMLLFSSIVWVFIILLKKLFLFVFETSYFESKISKPSLFIGFVISNSIFSSTIFDTITKLKGFILSIFGFTELLQNNEEQAMNFTKKISYISIFFFTQFKNALANFLFQIDLIDILIFFISWLVISIIIRTIINNTLLNIPKWYILNNNPALKNLLTSFIVISAIYLCIASLVAVPEFQNLTSQKNESSAEVNELKLYLDSQNNIKKEDLIIPFDSTNFPKQELFFKNFIRSYNDKVSNYWASDEGIKKRIVEAFKSSLQENTTITQTIRYKNKLSEWYINQHQGWINNTISMKNMLLTVTTYSFNDTESIQGQVTLYNQLSPVFSNADKEFTINISRPLPEKPKIGEQFGIFSKAFGWLLSTESLSLALIVGMFGFSLLGSIGSTFIRENTFNRADYKNPDASIIYPLIDRDIASILINGISATIVVFLAAKGAIIILTTNDDTNLNPYTLLFGCLLASVYSDNVWEWAKNWLDSKLNIKKKESE